MLSLNGDVTTSARQRTYPQPLKEEAFFLTPRSDAGDAATSTTPVASPGTESQRGRRLRRIGQRISIQAEENKEELVRYWDRFTRKGKNKIGVMDSLRTLVLSSCAFYSLLVILEC